MPYGVPAYDNPPDDPLDDPFLRALHNAPLPPPLDIKKMRKEMAEREEAKKKETEREEQARADVRAWEDGIRQVELNGYPGVDPPRWPWERNGFTQPWDLAVYDYLTLADMNKNDRMLDAHDMHANNQGSANETTEASPFVTWGPGGLGFCVHDKNRFISEFLKPKVDSDDVYASFCAFFVEKGYMITENQQTSDSGQVAFHHPSFDRNDPEALHSAVADTKS